MKGQRKRPTDPQRRKDTKHATLTTCSNSHYGSTDACQNLKTVGSGQPAVGFLAAQRQVFFAGVGDISVFDEDSLERDMSLANCGGGNFSATEIIADDTRQRLFVWSSWSYPDPGGGCVLAIDGEPLRPPRLRISDATKKAEGNNGASPFIFTVTLSRPSSSAVTVNYATANGTATAGSDYTAIPSTQLKFEPGQTSKTMTVVVTGDTAPERNETFVVNLSSANGATISDGQGLGIFRPAPTASLFSVRRNRRNWRGSCLFWTGHVSIPRPDRQQFGL